MTVTNKKRLDDLAAWMVTHGLVFLRLGLGLVFVWFGAPKLVPGLSPAEPLVAATVTLFDPAWFVPALGVAEVAIGLCLWFRRLVPIGLALMLVHMAGAALPLVTLPDVAWKSFPVATLEGQYIIKNIVLVAGAIVLAGASLGDVAARPPARRQPHRVRTRVATRPLAIVTAPRPDERRARSRASIGPAPRPGAALVRLARRAI